MKLAAMRATLAMVAARDIDEFGNVAGGVARHPQAGVEKTGSPVFCGRARGLHDPKAVYHAMDVVAFNGSEWRAVCDNAGPLPGDGWMLGAKASRAGQASGARQGYTSPRWTWSAIAW